MQLSITEQKQHHAAFPGELQLITLRNRHGLTVTLSNFGASIWSVSVAKAGAQPVALSLGYQDVADWATNPYYFGVTVGRVANRIGGAAFTHDGVTQSLISNEGNNQLHGGPGGFSHRMWQGEARYETDVDGKASVVAVFQLTSVDGDQGFAGNLEASIEYRLNDNNELSMNYHAISDKTTPICLTNHTYWNLSSDALSGILYHHLQINADHILALDDAQIPNGDLISVEGTAFDFNQAKTVGADISDLANGYDHFYVVKGGDTPELKSVATLVDQASGREMEILSTEPGVQFYSGNFLDGSLRSEQGELIHKHQGLCLETHGFPNAVNIAQFPTVMVEANTPYRQLTVHKFTHL